MLWTLPRKQLISFTSSPYCWIKKKNYRTPCQCKQFEGTLEKSSIIPLHQGPGTWQLPSHPGWQTSTACPQTGAVLLKESNLVLLEPAHHHFQHSSFLPKGGFIIGILHERFYAIPYNNYRHFPPFSVDPIFPITRGTHKNVSPLPKKQPFLLGEELWDSKVILKTVSNHSMKSPSNSSQVSIHMYQTKCYSQLQKLPRSRMEPSTPCQPQQRKSKPPVMGHKGHSQCGWIVFKHNPWLLTLQNNVIGLSSDRFKTCPEWQRRFKLNQSHCHPLGRYSQEGTKTKAL